MTRWNDWVHGFPTGGVGSGPEVFMFIALVVVLIGLAVFYYSRQSKHLALEEASEALWRRGDGSPYQRVSPVLFSDIGGHDEAKRELARIVDYLKDPEKYRRKGARIPSGILFDGPPGNGKTMLAQALANEAGVPFFAASGSEFVEMYVGVGAKRIRELFSHARKHEKAIVFIDEIDAIGGKRGGRNSHDERESTLNQLLTEMNGFSPKGMTFVLAATNRSDMLDEALTRPGRFTVHIHVDMPDLKARLAILRAACVGKPIDPAVDLEEIARRTSGMSGAGVSEVPNEAALLSVDQDTETITAEQLYEGIDRVLLGPRKEKVVSPAELERVAYHEAGHVVMAHLTGEQYTKVTIAPRSKALGFMLHVDERTLHLRSDIENKIRVCFGGRAAEELKFGEISTGVAGDLEQATRMARAYVGQVGMGGSLYSPQNDGSVSQQHLSRMDQACHDLMESAYIKAKEQLQGSLHLLEALAKELLAKETLQKTEIDAVLAAA